MDYKLWEDAGFGINGQQQPVQKNRGFFDALSDFASGTWANTSSMMDSTDLHKLREELLHPVAGTTPEEYEALKQQYRDLYNEQQQTRLEGQQAQNRLKQDGRIGEFAAYATNVGGSLPSMGLNLVGHATGSFPITNVLGSYMDAESAAIEASEKVLSEGGTLEQAEMAFKNALPKQIATTIPDTVVDQVIWGGIGKKLGLGKGAIDSAKRFASKLRDPATRIGSEVAFKTGKRFLGKGAGLVADSLMNVGSENIQEGSQNYVSDIEAARAMGQDVDYSLGGFKDSLLSKEGIETAKGTTAATLLTSLLGGAIKSNQYLSRGAETNVGIKTHNAFNGMQNEKGIKLNPQARAEQEMILSKLRGFSREELASWSDADIVAESAVAMGDMRKNITGEESDISQIREAVDTVARLSKDQNSITKEGEITEETRDLLTRMGLDEKDINDWFTSPTDVLAKARQVEQEEQAKQKQAEQEGEKPKTTIKVSPETGETLNVKQGEVVQGQKPTEQTTDTQEPITEKTTQNGLGEQAKQAEQQGTIQQDEEIEYPDSIIGWERDYDADNRDGIEYEGATYYSLKDNSISARIEPVGNGFTVIKVDEKGNATSDAQKKNFPSLKAAIDYLQKNKGETVFQGSDEQAQAELPSDGVNADAGNSGTLVGSVEDLYNLSQQEPDLLNPYEFAEFVRIKQHMGAGDLDVYFDRRKGYTLGEDGQWHEVNAKATPAATAKGRAIIQLYKGGDLGSAIHEIAHTAYWKLSDADKRTFGYYAIKTQGKYIADSLDEDYTPDFENRLLKLASKVSQNVELDEQDKQLQEKILNKASTNQIYDNLITFYNSKMNGGAVDLKNLTPQQQRAIEERWAWEMSQWYVEGYSVGVAPSNIIQRIAQRGCESIAKDLNSLARIWQHIHHKDNNEIENIYRGGQAEQQQEQAEQTPNINVQFTNELERQAMPNVNMPMNFGGEQAIQYGVPTLGESYNDAQEYANLYNELERRYANRQKMNGLQSADGSVQTIQRRQTQTEKKGTTTGYKETVPTTKANKEEEKLVDIIKNRKSGWEKALERLAEINPKTFRNILYSEAATQGEQVNEQSLTNQNESGIIEQKKEVADNGETENTRGTEDLQGNVGEVQGRGAVRTGDDSRTDTGRIQQETVEGSSEGNGKDIPLLKNTKFKSVYNKRKEKKTEIKDWRDLSDSDQAKQVYVDALNASKQANGDYGVYVSEQTVESLKDCKVVLHKNKMAGFAITPDGNIVGVFSNPKNPIRGVLNDMIFIARMMGGNSMDCFGDFLLYGYRACGFTPIARTTFDETYYPASDPKNATIRKESPDVFFLVKDNDNNTTYLDKMNKGEYKNDKIEADSIYHIEGKDSYDQALGFQGQVLNALSKNKNKSTKEVADSLRPKEETVTQTQETTEQTQAEQTETKEQPVATKSESIETETKVEKPTIPTDEIYSHLYFGDKTGKLKYNPETKKIEYFETEYGAPELVYNAELNNYVKKRSHKLVNKGEITPEQYNELKQRYEQDFRKAKGEKKENAPDLVEGMKKEDFMYSAYKETKQSKKEIDEFGEGNTELGYEKKGLVTDKKDESGIKEKRFDDAIKGKSYFGEMGETELAEEQKKEAKDSVEEEESPKVEKKKTEKQTKTKETKKTTTKPKTTDYLSALHKKYKYVTGTPIGEKGYRFKDDEKAFIEGFKGMIDGAIGNKEELVNVAKRLDSWFQNDPTERNRMVRKYLSQYLADAAKINEKQDTNVNSQLSDKAQEAQNILDKAFPNTRFQYAWHSTPHNFSEFTLKHLLEGEGAMAHGWGLYFGLNVQKNKVRYFDRLGKPHYAYGIRPAKIFVKGKNITKAIEKFYFDLVHSKNNNKFIKDLHNHYNTYLSELNTIKKGIQSGKFYNKDFPGTYFLDGSTYWEAFDGQLIKKSEINDYIQNLERRIKLGEKIVQMVDNDGVDIVRKPEENKNKFLFVDIPNDDVLLKEGMGFEDQPPKVQRALMKLVRTEGLLNGEEDTLSNEDLMEHFDDILGVNIDDYFGDIYGTLSWMLEDDPYGITDEDTTDQGKERCSKLLNQYGIKGIRYNGRMDGECAVIFDDTAIDIISKFKQEEGKWKSEKVDNKRNREIDKQKAQKKLQKRKDYEKKIHEEAVKNKEILDKAFPNTRFQIASHSGRVDFPEFSLAYLGTGVGDQVHGHGVYVSLAPNAAKGYFDIEKKDMELEEKLASKKPGKIMVNGVDKTESVRSLIYTYERNLGKIENENRLKTMLFVAMGNADAQYENLRKQKEIIEKRGLDTYQNMAKSKSLQRQMDLVEKDADRIERMINDIERGKIKVEYDIKYKNSPTFYVVNIPDIKYMIEEKAPFDEQPEQIKQGIVKTVKQIYKTDNNGALKILREINSKHEMEPQQKGKIRNPFIYNKHHNQIYWDLVYEVSQSYDKKRDEAKKYVSELLNKNGVQGIHYYGQRDGECAVIFNDKAIDILNKFQRFENKWKKLDKVDNARNRQADLEKAQRKLEKHRAKQNNARYQLHSEEGMKKADTNSPAFKNWFKGSILKNEDGSPKVFYRGIRQHYDPTFDKEEGGAVWIAEEKWFAENFRDTEIEVLPTKNPKTGKFDGKPTVHNSLNRGGHVADGDIAEVYANIKKPFNVEQIMRFDSNHDQYVHIGKMLGRDVENGIITAQQRLQVLKDLSFLNKMTKRGTYPNVGHPLAHHFKDKRFFDAFKKVGYDSIQGYEEGVMTYGIFDKGNVKSIYNKGTFDKNNKDIRYQLASEKGRPLANINTQKFKNWFGNSTAINTDGTPKVFYRGQGHQYDPNYKFDKTDANRNKLTWVAQTKEFVERGAYNGVDGEGDLWEVYIRTENPFNMGQIDYLEGAEKNPKQLYEHVIKKLEREVKYRRITKKQLEQTKEKLSYLREGKRSDGVVQEYGSAIYYFLDKDTKLVGALKDLGYDSILGIEDGTNTFALFSPNQVKSIYNNGDFDNNNNDIRYQKADETSNTNDFQIKSNGNIFGLNTKLSNEQIGQIQDDLMSFMEDSPSITKDDLRNLKNIYKNEISQYKQLYTISDNEDDREIATLNINNDKKKLQVVDKLLETMKYGDTIVTDNRPSNVIDITSRIKNGDSRFQKSDENQEKKLTKKQEKKLEIQKEIKEAKEKGQTTDTYKDVYSVSFTKSAQESKVNQEKMKYFDERKSAWERHEADGRVTYTRTTPFEHHQKVITYNGINDKIVEQKPKKKYREWMDFIKEKISKNLFNDQYALYKLATDLGLGNAYMRMIVTQGYAQKTGVALEKGIMYNGKRTRAMNDIAREIGEEKQPAFCEYAIAKHLQDIYNRPKNKIEQKYNKDEVDAVIKRVEASEDYKLFERCRKDLVEYNHACFHVLVDGGIITEQEFQKYVERDKNYVPLSKVMDKEDFGFNSIQFARSMVNVGSPIRKLGTSKREIKNIFGEMQKRTAIYYAAAARNKAGQIFVNEICNTLDKMYNGDTVSRGASIIRKVKVKEEDGKLITRPDADKQIFYVNNGGKHEFYQVSDPEIYRALRHLDEEQLHIINGMLEKMLSAPAGLVRATATATPDFGIRNIIRDNLTAFYTSEHGFIPIIDALWGMREIKRNGEFYQRYIDQVGEYGLKGRGELLKNNTYKLKDYRESLKDEVLKEFNILTDGKRSLKDRTKALLRMTIGAPFFAFGEQLERFNMYLEQGTRVGEFKNAKMGYNGLIDRITSDLSVDVNNARQSDIIAAYKAQDVTLYFSQHGLLGGKFNRFVPFLNASLLGAQKFVNAVDLAVTGKDSMNQKNTRLRKELLFKVALSTAFAIGLSAAGHGDEDYDEAPDYEKDTFWIFPNGIRIPKDEVFGRSIGTAVQRAFDQYYKEGKVDVLKTFESIVGMFKPNTVLPTVLDMFYGSIYNKDSFTGREIVPEYMTHRVGYQQKDIYTGNLAADLTEVLYKAFGINLSAKRVDWALQKNLTNAKKYLDAVYDVKEKLTDPEHFNEKMARGYDKNDSTGSFVGGLRDDVPPVLNLVTGTFATNRSQYQSVSDFQKKYQEIKRIADNDSDIPMTREQKRKWQRYEKAYKEYTKLRKQLKAIRSNASLSGADKREKAEPIFKKQIKLAEWAEG